MNAMSANEYQEIKNEVVTVVSFTKEGRRVESYGNLNYKKAMEHIILQQALGYQCLVVFNLPILEVSRERKDYDKYVVDQKGLEAVP